MSKILAILLCLLASTASAQTLSGDRVELLAGPCTISSGSGAPSAGTTCDVYVDYVTGDLYTKKGGTWTVLPRTETANIWTTLQTISSTEPILYFYETDQGVNLKRSKLGVQGGVLSVQTVDDAGSSVLATILTLSRAGELATLAGISGTTGTFSGAVSGTTGTFSSAVSGTTGTFTSTVSAGGLMIPTVGVRLPNAQYILGRNTSAVSRNLIGIDASNIVQIASSGDATNIGGALTVAGITGFTTNVSVGTANVNSLVSITATLTGNTGNGTGLNVSSVLTPAAGFLGRGLIVAPFLNEASSGTHTLMSGATFSNANGIASGAATVTDTANVYIDGAYSATVTGINYALWVAAGITRLGGAVTLDSTLGVGGNATFLTDILPATNYTSNAGSLSKKLLTVHAAELWVETLVAQNTMATIGGRVLVAPTNILSADLAPAGGTITVKYNNFANGDRIYMEANGSLEWMAVTSAAGGSAGVYTYTVTRNLDGSGANQWYAGDAALNTGTTGNGFIDLYSTDGVMSASHNGPTIVGNVRTGTTYSDIAPRWAIGNLDGLYGYSGSTYGAAFGDASNAWLAMDSTNGLRGMSGANVRFQIAANGSGSLANSSITWDTSGNLTVAGSATIGGWSIGSTAITANSATVGISSAITGGDDIRFFAGDVIGGSPEFKVTEAGAMNASNATLTGASGTVVIDSSGIKVTPGSACCTDSNGYRFVPTDGKQGLYSFEAAGNINMQLQSRWEGATASKYSAVLISATSLPVSGTNESTQLYMYAGGGLSSQILAVAHLYWFQNATSSFTNVGIRADSGIRTGYAADTTTYTQSNANLLAGNNTEALGVAGTSTLANLNFYKLGQAQRLVTLQATHGGASNLGGILRFFTKDDAAAGTDVVQAGYVDFSTGGAGGALVWGAPTNGGACGAGCINAKSVRDDDVVLTDWVYDLHYDGASSLPHAGRLYSLVDVQAITETEHRLPWMPTKETFEKERGLGSMITRLWQGQEQQMLYLLDHEARFAALEAELRQLKGGRQ